MSTDDQHPRDCFEVLSVVYGFLDGELDDVVDALAAEHQTELLEQLGEKAA